MRQGAILLSGLAKMVGKLVTHLVPFQLSYPSKRCCREFEMAKVTYNFIQCLDGVWEFRAESKDLSISVRWSKSDLGWWRISLSAFRNFEVSNFNALRLIVFSLIIRKWLHIVVIVRQSWVQCDASTDECVSLSIHTHFLVSLSQIFGPTFSYAATLSREYLVWNMSVSSCWDRSLVGRPAACGFVIVIFSMIHIDALT